MYPDTMGIVCVPSTSWWTVFTFILMGGWSVYPNPVGIVPKGIVCVPQYPFRDSLCTPILIISLCIPKLSLSPYGGQSVYPDPHGGQLISPATFP